MLTPCAFSAILRVMYIRRTKTRTTADGTNYYTHRLVQSERVDGKVRQRTLLNLGRHFDLAQDLWPVLCSRLEQLLGGQESFDFGECSAEVEEQAQKLLAQLLVQQGSLSENVQAAVDMQSVDVNSLRLVQPRSVGVEALGLWAMEQVGLISLLQSLNLTAPQRAAIVGLIIARMAAPDSERATYRWLKEHSALGELLDFDYTKMSLMQLYRASDLLMKHRQKIEDDLFTKVQNLFGFSCTVTLYDLTNTYFEGSAQRNSKARYGRSKEKRSDCPLLTLGMVLDASGFVRSSEVFSGNVSEGTTLKAMLSGLEAPAGALVIMDRGIATEANLMWLREQGYRYLVVSRERQRQFDSQEAISIQSASNQTIHLQKVLADDSSEVRLYCYSEQRAQKEKAIAQQFSQRFENELKKLNAGLNRPHTTKKIDKVWERIGRLKEKSHGVSQHYQIEIIPDDQGKNAREIIWKRTTQNGTAHTHPGIYCLRTNEINWDEEQLWRTYVMLTDLEAVFRSLKSELGLRPIYHHKEDRSDAHLFITVIAYQLVQLIRRKLGEQGDSRSWSSLRSILSNQCRMTAIFKREDGHTLHIRKTSQAEPEQQAIYQCLNLDSSPGRIKKMIV